MNDARSRQGAHGAPARKRSGASGPRERRAGVWGGAPREKEMREFYARCGEPKELVVIDAADHLFDGKVSEVADAIDDLLSDWA